VSQYLSKTVDFTFAERKNGQASAYPDANINRFDKSHQAAHNFIPDHDRMRNHGLETLHHDDAARFYPNLRPGISGRGAPAHGERRHDTAALV